MSPAPRRRRALGTLAILGIVALVVGGFAVFSATRVLGEFFGTSGRSSGGHHERPPVPAAPTSSDPAAPEATRDLAAAAARVRDLEAALQEALAHGDDARGRELRAQLTAAQADWRRQIASPPAP